METNGTHVGSLIPTPRNLESYNEIILTDEEQQEVLRLARKRKYHAQKEKEYFASLKREPEKVKMDKGQFLEFIRSNNPDFDVTMQAVQLGKILDYFTSESEKGLMLFGGVGAGKTFLMNIFSANPKASYGVISCREVSALYTKEGYESIRQFYAISKGYRNGFGHHEYGKCFDDLGEEKNKKYFGNELNVMEDIIESRYNNKGLWKYTHITTNLTVQQIEEIYGKRVRSRMREMFEIVDFVGINDLRK